MLFVAFIACSSGGTGPVQTVQRFFDCMDHHDIKCLWRMSGPKTRKVFTRLAVRLEHARDIVFHKIPAKYRQRYVKSLLLDKFSSKITPEDCMTVLLKKNLLAPAIAKKDMVVNKIDKNSSSVYLPGNTTVILVRRKDRLTLEVLGDTLVNLPIYHTLQHNMDVLDKDAALFARIQKTHKNKQ